MVEKEIYIHIGMHKTATSFLQYNFFPNLEDFYYIKDIKKDKPIYSIIDKIVYSHPICFDYKQLQNEANIFFNKLEKDKIIISIEGLIGDMSNSYLDFEKNIDFIKKVFPTANILVTIRRQDKWLESAYKQLLHEYWSISFKQYTDIFIKKSGLPSFDYRMLNYKYMYNEINQNFNNVVFLPFELFVKDKEDFISRMFDFLKIDNRIDTNFNSFTGKNRGYSLITANIAFILNRFFAFPQNSLGFLTLGPIKRFFLDRYDKNSFFKFFARVFYRISFRIFLQRGIDRIIYIKYNPMSTSFKNKILEFHKQSNKELSKILGINLSQYGYH